MIEAKLNLETRKKGSVCLPPFGLDDSTEMAEIQMIIFQIQKQHQLVN